MSELRQELDIPLVLPSRKSRLETYFFDDADEASDQIASRLYDADKPMAKTAVIIPVAVHQEDGSIIREALEQYAKQETDEPFTVFLYFNCPETSADAQQTASNMIDFQMIQQDYEGTLDVRGVMRAYSEPAPIGQIRKDIWDGVAKLAYHEGIYDRLDGEVIGINNDIDTSYLSPRYIKKIQQYYALQQHKASRDGFDSWLLNPVATLASHEYPFATHPNTAKAVFWSDLAHRKFNLALGGGFEAGMVIPLSDYAKNRGFDPEAVTYETSSVAHNGKHHPPIIPGTVLKTSPRRYIDRFPENGFNIWTDESFGSDDDCRETDVMSGRSDATKKQLEDHVTASLLMKTRYFLHRGVQRSFGDISLTERTTVNNQRELDELTSRFESHMYARLRAEVALARQVLVRVMDLPAVALRVDESVNIDTWVAENSKLFREDVYRSNAFMWDTDTVFGEASKVGSERV